MFPATTMYAHESVVDAVTAGQVAAVAGVPVSSKSDDSPVEVIASENATDIGMTAPALYDPPAVDVVMPVTVGAVVSITSVLLA